MAVVGLSEKCRCCPGRKIADDNSPCHPLPVNSVMATCHRSRWAAGSEDKGVLMLGAGVPNQQSTCMMDLSATSRRRSRTTGQEET